MPLASRANVRRGVFTFARAALDAVTFRRFRTTPWSGRRYMTPKCPNFETQRRGSTNPSIKPSGLVTPVRSGPASSTAMSTEVVHQPQLTGQKQRLSEERSSLFFPHGTVLREVPAKKGGRHPDKGSFSSFLLHSSLSFSHSLLLFVNKVNGSSSRRR